MENVLPCKRLADGSKRVQVPHFLNAQVKLKKPFLAQPDFSYEITDMRLAIGVTYQKKD